jgi:hypothetical protein
MPWETIGWIVVGCGVIVLLGALLREQRPDHQPSYTAVQNSDIERGPQATTTQDDSVRSDDDQNQEK